MTQPETRIVKKITDALDKEFGRRCWYFKVHGSPFQAAGVPDLLGVLDGRFFGVEVKVPGNKATKLQELIMRRIIEAGGRAGVATSPAEALAIVTGEQAESSNGGKN